MAYRIRTIRRHLLMILGGVLFLMATVSIVFIYRMQAHHIEEEIESRLAVVRRLYQNLLQEEAKLFEAQLSILMEDKDLAQIWVARDRDRLQAYSFPIFERLRRRFNMDHFYFIDPDRSCFLRVHQPDLFGDLIERQTLAGAARSGKAAAGMELGPLGTFTLRVVQSWLHEGKVSGYLELGESFENFLPKLQQLVGVDMLFLVNKELLTREKWEEGMRMLGQVPQWEEFPESVVSSRTLRTIPAELARLIRAGRREPAGQPFLIGEEDGKKFQGGFLPLQDAGGRELGQIAVLLDVTEEMHDLYMQSGLLVAITVFLSGFLFVFFFFHTGRIERNLLAARAELEKENEERRQAQQELLASRQQLEERVDARTADLRAANAALHEEISQRRTAEQEASQAKEEWERTFDAISDVVTLQDSQMRIIRANRAAAEIFGLEPAALAGRFCYELFRGAEAPCEGCPEMLALRTMEGHMAEISHPGLGKTFLVSASLLRDRQGEFSGLVHVAKDITAQKMLEQQLRESQKIEAVGTLAGGVAHDFNNLLTGIAGYTELCLDDAPPGTQLQQDLAEVLRLSRRGAELTRQLLAFSRQQSTEPVVLDLNALVNNLLKMLRRLIGEDIELTFAAGSGLARVEADPGQMEQVLINLAVNARDAMPAGGKLFIHTANLVLDDQEGGTYFDLVPGDYVCLQVRDTGCGMEPATVERIFEPFYSTKKNGHSSGLGLAVIHGIITQHRGGIRVESSPGKGTTFTILLPRSSDGGESQSKDGPLVFDPAITVLLVEDEPAVRKVIQRMLERAGCRVILASGPLEAEAVYAEKKNEIELLLTDVIMPKQSGLELFDKLRQGSPALRVLFMSGHLENSQVLAGIAAAGLPFIAKPFMPEKLIEMIRDVLQKENAK